MGFRALPALPCMACQDVPAPRFAVSWGCVSVLGLVKCAPSRDIGVGILGLDHPPNFAVAPGKKSRRRLRESQGSGRREADAEGGAKTGHICLIGGRLC